MRKKVAVVIPAYDEASVIREVIAGIKKELRKTKFEFGIIVVNDCSGDNTSSVSRRARVVVIDHLVNTGVGGATATGLGYTKKGGYDVVATMDADGQHDPKDVVKGVRLLLRTRSDLLIGNRLIDTKGMSKTKIIGNRGLSLITRLLFGTNISDSQSGLRIFSKRAIKELNWSTGGYEFCSEMIWRAKQAGLVCGEYPIRAIYTEHSRKKGQSNWNAVNIIKSLVRQRLSEIL